MVPGGGVGGDIYGELVRLVRGPRGNAAAPRGAGRIRVSCRTLPTVTTTDYRGHRAEGSVVSHVNVVPPTAPSGRLAWSPVRERATGHSPKLGMTGGSFIWPPPQAGRLDS